jgi:hypothetical protein
MSPACSAEPSALVEGFEELGLRNPAAVEPRPFNADRLKLELPKVRLCAPMALALSISLEFKSKSAVKVLGALPSLDTVLSKAFLKATKLALSCVFEAYPAVSVVTVGLLAINASLY